MVIFVSEGSGIKRGDPSMPDPNFQCECEILDNVRELLGISP
jgi:hypothetical protein